MEAIKIQHLIGRCTDYFQANCYTGHRISRYISLWKHGIIPFMKAKGIDTYAPAIGAEFIETCHYHGSIRPQEREKIRSVQVLDDMMTLGLIRKRCYTPVFHSLDGEIGQEMEKLITRLSNLRRGKTTINDYRLYLSEFLYHLTSTGITRVKEISERHILSFISSHPTSKVNIVSALRVLFRFWEQEHILEGGFNNFFDTYKIRRPERLPSFYQPEDIAAIENSISRSSGVGKRNYAMVLLASRLGLRASDIANLRFDNIDWEKNVITLAMRKTRKIIELPLLAEVGNAIIDYLRHGRPESGLNSLFLSSRAPYASATKACVCAAISHITNQSGVRTDGKHHGPHSLRHSLAGVMLNAGTTLPVISEVLGHESTQTTMLYLKIDILSLLKCALPVPAVPDDFYLQRGGVFYE
jgi:site-specific recombinase XerD